MVKKTNKVYNVNDFENDSDFPLMNDNDRLRYMKANFSKMTIGEAFNKYYKMGIRKKSELSELTTKIDVTNIEIGSTYIAKFVSNDDDLTFTINGVKEEIYSKEHFSEQEEYGFMEYLSKHDNNVKVKVIGKHRGKWVVSVKDAYYNDWYNEIEETIKNSNGLRVHINALTKGGYNASISVWTLSELFGVNYTCVVFIPGSQIVMNKETNFEQWVGQDVDVVPQKFTTYRESIGAPIENCLVCSRKSALQIQSYVNLYNMYNNIESEKEKTYESVVTGIINSNTKVGVFVELTDSCVTGMVNVTNPDELVNYKVGDKHNVTLETFEMFGNEEPFKIDKKHSKITKCNVKPIFKFTD